MKRVMLGAIALVASLFVVTTAGAADPVTVSLAAHANTVVWGSGTTVTGTATGAPVTANQQVLLTFQAYGKATASPDVKATGTGADGSFSFTVAPTIQSTYTAHWGSALSTPVTINVKPLVGFGRHGTLFKARVRSEIGYGGHFVWAQRHTAHGWRAVKRVVIGKNGRAAFHLRLPHGLSKLRLFLPSGQAGAGYLASQSRTLFYRR